MATFANGLMQSANEIKTYTIDYTNDLPTGGTVTGGTATHIPPSGTASPVTVSVVTPYVYATLPVQSVTGVHYLDILATFSDGDLSSVRVPINVVYPATPARSGMADIVSDLRAMTDASAEDYEVAGVPYWTDAQLQRILDKHRTDLKWSEMEAQEEASGAYLDYSVGFGNLESTAGAFAVQDVNGNDISSSLYSVDYQRGVITFLSDTGGTQYFVTGRSYDLEGAAAEVWKMKQSHYASAVNFSTKVHTIARSQLYEHAREMAEFYSSLGDSGFGTMDIIRSDTDS